MSKQNVYSFKSGAGIHILKRLSFLHRPQIFFIRNFLCYVAIGTYTNDRGLHLLYVLFETY